MRFPQICFGLGLAMAFTFAFAQGAPIVRSSLSVRDSPSGRALDILSRGEPAAQGSSNNVQAHPQGSSDSQGLSNENRLKEIDSNLNKLWLETEKLMTVKPGIYEKPHIYRAYISVEKEMMDWENNKNPSSEQEDKAKTFLTKNEEDLTRSKKRLAENIAYYRQSGNRHNENTPQGYSDSQNTSGKENPSINERFLNLFIGYEDLLKMTAPQNFDFYSSMYKEVTAWSKVENPSAEKMEEMETFIKKSEEELAKLERGSEEEWQIGITQGSPNNVQARPQGSPNSQGVSNKDRSLLIRLKNIEPKLKNLWGDVKALIKNSKNRGLYRSYASVEKEMMDWENIKTPTSEQEDKAKMFLTENEKALADRLLRYKLTQGNSGSQNTSGKENLTIKERFLNLFNGCEYLLKTKNPKDFDLYSRVNKEITAWPKVENPSAEKIEEMETFIKNSKEELAKLEEEEN